MNDAGGNFLKGYLPPEAEEAIALQFAALHKEELKYVPAWGWLCWTGSHWRLDDTLKAIDLVRALCRDVAELEPSRVLQKSIASAKTVLAVERLARADRRYVVAADAWDRDPWLLCTPEGVVDLRTGTIRPAERTDYMTKSTAVSPGGECELWLKFLDRVCAGNRELVAYLARVVGYLLTAITREHVLFFLYGKGGNGKTTFVEVIMEILADYARAIAMELLVETNGQQHPTGLAGLRGARLAKAVETEEGRSWALGRIKAMTGGDRLSARLMRRDFFDFDPTFKLLVMGNHRPKLRRVDQAIRRRLHLIPFTVTIEPDRQFRDKLRGELPESLPGRSKAVSIGRSRVLRLRRSSAMPRPATSRRKTPSPTGSRSGPNGEPTPGPRSASSRQISGSGARRTGKTPGPSAPLWRSSKTAASNTTASILGRGSMGYNSFPLWQMNWNPSPNGGKSDPRVPQVPRVSNPPFTRAPACARR